MRPRAPFVTASHPFYAKVSEIRNERRFDQKMEYLRKRYFKPVMGRPEPTFVITCGRSTKPNNA